MATYFGLYYPYIHFHDEGWLKLTALYWDGMKRIVPFDVDPNDSDEIKLLVDSEFIQNQHPAIATHEVSQPFRRLIAERGDALRAAFSVPEHGRRAE